MFQGRSKAATWVGVLVLGILGTAQGYARDAKLKSEMRPDCAAQRDAQSYTACVDAQRQAERQLAQSQAEEAPAKHKDNWKLAAPRMR